MRLKRAFITPVLAALGLHLAQHRLGVLGEILVDVDAAGRRLDLARFREGVAALRAALDGAAREMEGWRCVLLLPAFTDTLNGGNGYWRSILRIRAIVEAV